MKDLLLFLSLFPVVVTTLSMGVDVGGLCGRGTTCIDGNPARTHNSQKSVSKFPVGVYGSEINK